MTRVLRLLLFAATFLLYFSNAAAQSPTAKEAVTVSQAETREAPKAAPKVKAPNAQSAPRAIVKQEASKPENSPAVEDNITSSTKDTSKGLPSSRKIKQAAPAKAEKVTVTPPSSATIAEWDINGTFYYVGNDGWEPTTDYLAYSGSTIQVAIDGNDIYIAGLCPKFPSAWVKGTISGTTATFATGQYYGTTSNDKEFWFVGEDENDQECDVVFNYDADAKRLTQVTTYINNMTADTGGSYYSYFMNMVLTMPREITACDGTANNEYIPVYGYWIDTNDTESQMIYPKAKLPGLQAGDLINSITFYTYTSSTATVPAKLGSATVQVRMGETTATTISSSTLSGNRADATVVYEGTLSTGANTMTITFDEPYIYEGKNLLIDTYVINGTSDYAHCYWAGESASSGASYNSRTGAQSFLPKMMLAWSLAIPDESLDFETVEVGSSKTMNAIIRNSSGNTVTATLTATAPFSVQSSSITMTPGTNLIPITFTPTEARVYNGTFTIDINGPKNIPLTGIGNVTGSPAALRDSTFFAGINYEWTDSLNVTHLSGLDEIATDPDQMIAMMREVYTNKTIPGNFKRGYTAAGASEEFDDVYYSGVGEITRSSSGYNSATYYSYNNAYGWDIPGDVKYGYYESYYTSDNYYDYYNDYHYAYLDTVQYKPNQEGVTLLLVEVVDDFNKNNLLDGSDWKTFSTNNYQNLREYIKKSIKSVRVITQAKRTGTGYDAGTLFKIDCDKMNKFFMLAKGQVRWVNNSYWGKYAYNSSTNYNFVKDFCAPPCYISFYNEYRESWYGDKYYDEYGTRFFWHMFEQFSPVQHDASAAKADIYQDLVNMDTFDVQHDCMSIIPSQNHQFMMYGNESGASDCQDVRDLMFFVPDYRMMKWSDSNATITDRDPGPRQKFLNYNPNHAPKMGLYVIRQNEIQGAQVSGKDMYKLTLSWDSNLDDFLPSNEQEYQLLQVVISEDGTEEYVPVYYMNSNGQYTDKNGNVVDEANKVPIVLQLNPNDAKEYTEVYVAMQNSSQQVTYAIRGCDTSHFLSLQVSNKRDFLIPGLDDDEMIKLTDATHYSRFNAQSVKNCYSNKLVLENNAIGINNDAIVDGENGTKLLVKRTHTENVDGVATTVEETVATITFNNHASSSRTLTVTMDNQSPKSEYPEGKTSGTGAGYHANKGETSWTQSYSIVTTGDNQGNIVLTPALTIFDNFVVDVANNDHPSAYSYKVETNYPGVVYLDATGSADNSNFTQGNEVWYAWTWPTGGDGQWVKGRATSTSGKFMFTPVQDNIEFVRMNPNGAPSWNSNVAWNRTGNLTVDGDTYTLTQWTSGNWSGSNDATAHSNDLRIPIYKTDSRVNNVFTKAEIDADKTGYMELPENLAFEEKVQYSSKTEILRYDVYRWGETDNRYIVNVVGENDEEEDIAPDGIAGNQGGKYTVSMNEVGTEDYFTSSVTVDAGEDDKWATFVDHKPAKEKTGKAFTYAPVVESFTFGKDVNNKVRTDYNSYGGPLQTTAMGKLSISVVEPSASNPLMSEYTWEKGGKKYAYYNIKLNIDTKSVPDGYEIYKIRAWREIDESLLAEQYDECGGRISDSYKFEELTYPNYDKNSTYVLGSKEVDLSIEDHAAIKSWTGTFGAQKLRTSAGETGVIEELDACFFVRIYFTRTSNLTNGSSQIRRAAGDAEQLPADGKFYVVEASYDFTAQGGDNVITGVLDIDKAKQIVGVKYYNAAGIESDTPFQGVNIVVTRYNDGSTMTSKVIR